MHRGASEIRRWMFGAPGYAGYGDLVAMERIFDLNNEETHAIEAAFFHDVRARMKARRK